ncbi:MAG: BlaI/MecI/CopY family transcriptional regulator [Ruminococcaceae bacterium]|nr:BlaI/MecI/CopY family transcriptional regulator [Oscillospiraceae bacterium]
MKAIERLPESELEIMLTLWHSEKPMTAGEITKKLSEIHGWKTGTVHVLLERLYERGFVSCDKSGYKHLFSPVIKESDYRKGEEHTMMQRFFGGSAKNMIASLLNADGLSDDDLEEIAVMLKKKTGGK